MTTATATPTGTVTLYPVRIGYPYIFKARKSVINGQAKEKFEAVLLIDKKDAALVEQTRAAIKAAFVNKFGSEVKLAKDKQPLKDGDASTTEDESDSGKYPGYFYANVSAFPDNPPQIKNADKTPATDPASIKSGDFVIMSLKPRAYAFENTKGVSLDLLGVRKIKSGDPIGSAGTNKAAVADALDAIDVEVSEVDADEF
jgi:hypothetical protein